MRVKYYDGSNWVFRDGITVHSDGTINIPGSVVVVGNLTAANQIVYNPFKASFSASTRLAVYMPGTLSTDYAPVSWQLTSDTGTHTGGHVWSFTKADSIIVNCTTACSEQVTGAQVR